MKRSFTLIELIFAIVVIGILAFAAIPQLKNLQKRAWVTNIIKQTREGAKEVAESATIYKDLEGKVWDPHCNNINYPDNPRWSNNFCLKNLISLKGKNWKYGMRTIDEWFFNGISDTRSQVAQIGINATNVWYVIDCRHFDRPYYNDPKARAICKEMLNGSEYEKVILNW